MSARTLPHPARQTRQCVSEQVRMCQLIQNVNERGNQVYIFTPVPSRPHVHVDGCLFILGKERVEPRA